MTVQLKASITSLIEEPVPALGGGDTAGRWLSLHRWARLGSVSVARMAEAHLDATAILTEAGLPRDPDAGIYGVWASGPGTTAVLSHDEATLTGTKPFASGLGLVDRALVTVVGPTGEPGCLVEVDTSGLDRPQRWTSGALVDTLTGPADLSSCPVVRVVGVANWYLNRPGFWHGAIGPAACWAGAAAGLVDAALDVDTDDPHRVAACGELYALGTMLESILIIAGDATDADPADRCGANMRALASRHLIERTATTISDLYSRTVGPRPFVTDAETAQRHADLHLYLRQHHGAADLEALGRSVLG